MDSKTSIDIFSPSKFITDQNAVLVRDPNSLDSDSEGPTAEELVQRYMERVRPSYLKCVVFS